MPSPRFAIHLLSSRIVQQRKVWLAQALELRSPAEIPSMLGAHWWFHFGAALSEVVMPTEFYQVGPPDNLKWDEIGLRALARDWAAWPGVPSDDLMFRSQFNLLCDIGIHLFGRRSRAALEFATNRIGRLQAAAQRPQQGPPVEISIDSQIPLMLLGK